MMSRYHGPVTPAEVGRELASLCASLAPNVEPIYVSAKPIEGAPKNECFPLVEAIVSQEGGMVLLGWSLWEFPGVFVEAELHAVWSSPTGELIDVTPKNHPVGRILFLPSNNAVYSGRQTNNIRRALSNDPCVTEYFATFDREFELLNRGARADQHGEIELTDSEADEYNSIQERKAFLFPQILLLAAHIGAYTPCPCNSGKKVRWCHGANNVG
ncbi:MAG: zinc chelation protein SecC [Gammaproteobacteria bacterium]|nr:zinc chelation protein SecC [Gammaproteobacteria bacterium]